MSKRNAFFKKLKAGNVTAADQDSSKAREALRARIIDDEPEEPATVTQALPQVIYVRDDDDACPECESSYVAVQTADAARAWREGTTLGLYTLTKKLVVVSPPAPKKILREIKEKKSR